MSARRGWVFDNPPRTGNWPEPQPWWGVSAAGNTHPHLHSRCPVCGYATRFKQFGPIPCACPPGSVAALVTEVRATNTEHLHAGGERSGPPLRIGDRYSAGRPGRGNR